MSGRKRFFAESIDFATNTAIISGDEYVHAHNVQHIQAGSEICLLDGSGKQYTAIVTAVKKGSLTAHIIDCGESDKEPKERIYLIFGALKGDKSELVVQKACELGVSKIAIFSSQYCAAYINENKIERLNKIAREAAKQCMRSTVPEIQYFNNLNDALLSASEYKNKLFACEFAPQGESKIQNLSGSTAIVTGSEGGFSQQEFELSLKYGFSPVFLGKRILRAETAAIAMTAICGYLLGELE